MNNFELLVWDNERRMTTFLTVKKVNNMYSEMDSFLLRFQSENKQLQNAANQLYLLITHTIGNKYGAIDDFFTREENLAHSLPPKPHDNIEEIRNFGKNFSLRLFCYRINEKIVVLFNGGIKDKQTIQECDDLFFKFNEAQSFVSKIKAAFNDKYIIFNEHTKEIKDFQGNNNPIL